MDVDEPLQHPPGRASEETELSRISFQSLLYMHAMSPRSPWGQFFPSWCPQNDLRGSSPSWPCCTEPHEPLSAQRGSRARFLRCHLIGFFWADISGRQFREECRQPVLSFSSCLGVQPSQAFLQQMILEIRVQSMSLNIPSLESRVAKPDSLYFSNYKNNRRH